MVTKVLFEKYPTAMDFDQADIEDIQAIIKPCGFYNNKSKDLKSLSHDIVHKFNNKFPKNKEQLKSLAGVGEKTANVVVSLVYNTPAIAVDTHVFRVSNRLGLAAASTPEKTQKQLEQILNKKDWSKSHYALVLHGRYVCKAIKPRCEQCCFNKYCAHFNKLQQNLQNK